MRVFALVLLLCAALASGCSASAESSAGGTAGAADTLSFSATTVDGADFAGSSLEGKPTVLWFWAPWCPTCRGQADGVAALATKYAGTVNVVGVGSLDESGAIKDFADAVPADMPQLLDPDGKVWRHFGITAQSTYVVLDAEHKVVSSGYLSDDELAAEVADLTS